MVLKLSEQWIESSAVMLLQVETAYLQMPKHRYSGQSVMKKTEPRKAVSTPTLRTQTFYLVAFTDHDAFVPPSTSVSKLIHCFGLRFCDCL